MTDRAGKSLLPNGLRDVLPPDAAREAAMMDGLIGVFAAHGYERVDPPLVEFEDSLLDGPGAAMAAHTFRLMDPVSQRMMGVRADMTPQVARIAASRLRREPRPLRLCYGGSVLRVRGSQLRPERQFRQAGCELIGAAEAAADAEAISVAVAALGAIGVSELTVDISLPTVVPAVCAACGLDRGAAQAALEHRDAAAVAALGGEGAQTLGALLRAAGPPAAALAALDALDLPDEAAAERERLRAVLDILTPAPAGVSLTVDPVENRGFEYQTGLSFTIFARGVRGEMGRGGRYLATGSDEPATGFSLYLDSITRAARVAPLSGRVYVPAGADGAAAMRLRAEGWATVAGLSPVTDAAAEARRLKCSHYLADGAATPVPGREGNP